MATLQALAQELPTRIVTNVHVFCAYLQITHLLLRYESEKFIANGVKCFLVIFLNWSFQIEFIFFLSILFTLIVLFLYFFQSCFYFVFICLYIILNSIMIFEYTCALIDQFYLCMCMCMCDAFVCLVCLC